MLPARGKSSIVDVWPEEPYVPRAETYPVETLAVDERPPLEMVNAAFSKSNANATIGTEVRSRTENASHRALESGIAILPHTPRAETNLATIEEDWSYAAPNVQTTEVVGKYKDRMGRMVDISVDVIPDRQFDEPKLAHNNAKKMQLFTGTQPKVARKEAESQIAEPDTKCDRDEYHAKHLVHRGRASLVSNRQHTHDFTDMDTCRGNYHGYNLKAGNDTRAQKLPDTNRTHYAENDFVSGGVDLESLCLEIQQTQRVENDVFRRDVVKQPAAFDACPSWSVPELKEAEVVADGRTGLVEMEAIGVCDHVDSDRLMLPENELYVFGNNTKRAHAEGCNTRPGKRRVVRNDEILNRTGGRTRHAVSAKAACVEAVPSLQRRGKSVDMYEGQRDHRYALHSHVRMEKEVTHLTDDFELSHIIESQVMDGGRVYADHALGRDRAVDVTHATHSQTRGATSCMPVKPSIVKIRRHQEVAGQDGRQRGFETKCSVHPDKIQPRVQDEIAGYDGSIGAFAMASHVSPDTLLGDGEAFEINMDALGQHAYMNTGECQSSRDKARTLGEMETSHLGIMGKLADACKYILPTAVYKRQLTSGTEIDVVTARRATVDCVANRGTTILSVENTLRGRTGGGDAVLNTCVPKNIVPGTDKRGLKTVSRLTNQGLARVERDRRVTSCDKTREHRGRGEHQRPLSAMSAASDKCRMEYPQMKLKEERGIGLQPRC
jgi:hypothetical protein